MTSAELNEYVQLAGSDLSSDNARQARFVELGRLMAAQLADDLGLDPASFWVQEVDFRPGVVLRAEHLSVTLESLGGCFMFCPHAGWDDRCGGCSNLLTFRSLQRDYAGVVRMLRNSMALGSTLLAHL